MHKCIDELYRKAKLRARALLRCRRIYSGADMLFFFKTRVRSQIERCYGAIFHAASSKLERLDTVQSLVAPSFKLVRAAADFRPKQNKHMNYKNISELWRGCIMCFVQ